MTRLHKIFVLVLAASLLVPATASAGRTKKKPKTTDVTFMTRNLYLGADIIKLATAGSPEEFERNASDLFNVVRQTDFRSRAPLIADEIRRTKPDFIGLQEVALWRRGADGVKDGSATPATTVVYDWLADLRKELNRRGLKYRVVQVQDELDVEGPTADGYDIRFTQRDAILMRSDRKIRFSNARSGNFDAAFSVNVQGVGNVRVKRGWNRVDATLNGARFRFVNTHLEAYSEEIGTNQAKELTARDAGPARYRGQTVLVGDMNSARNSDDSDPIDHLLGYKFDDTFFRKNRRNVFTCCQPETIDNAESQLRSRIDYVLAKPKAPVRKSVVVGNNPRIRTASGLWPSDHAGVVSTLRLKRKR